jgi:hypothetical protein
MYSPSFWALAHEKVYRSEPSSLEKELQGKPKSADSWSEVARGDPSSFVSGLKLRLRVMSYHPTSAFVCP